MRDDTPKTDASEKAAEVSLRAAGVLAAGFCRVLDMQDLECDNARLRAENAKLRRALGELLASAVVLSDDYLAAFSAYRDTDTIQGWDKARWLRASAAAKQARAALRGEG